jgi:hypothetical protein
MLQNPHSRNYDLSKLLNQLPKDVLVEKLYNNILISPVFEGIRAYRALEKTLDQAFNDGADAREIEALAEPLKGYIGLMFDLHEEIEQLLELENSSVEVLEDEMAKKKKELLETKG